jgi:HlyD family secretion protein/epimerase transport system membrane fusion protein
MNKQLIPSEFTPIGVAADAAVTTEQKRQIRGPIRSGGIVIGVFVVGFFVWASVFKLAGGVSAPGIISVENNRKTVQHLDGGIVRRILVREGQTVKAGDVLIEMDDNNPRAQVEVLRSDYDNLIAQRARLEAEIDGASRIDFPAELLARRNDPVVARMIRDQTTLFNASLGVYRAQTGVLNQRVAQLQNRIAGYEAQATAVNRQSALIGDELTGVQSLYDRGFAPKSRMLALERNAAELTGARGARMADIAGAQEAVGENRIQMNQLAQTRAAQAGEQLRDTQGRLAELTPRLRATEAVLARTIVRAPVSGKVLGLTQFTEGGVAAPGQKLMDVVPTGAPLVIQTRVRPDHIDEVHEGMEAEVTLAAFKSREVSPIKGRVTRISADVLADEQGVTFYTATLVASPEELGKLPPGVKLAAGMPVMATIVTGERTVMSYLLSPFKIIARDALREN